jgi:hypothetical protein
MQNVSVCFFNFTLNLNWKFWYVPCFSDAKRVSMLFQLEISVQIQRKVEKNILTRFASDMHGKCLQLFPTLH